MVKLLSVAAFVLLYSSRWIYKTFINRLSTESQVFLYENLHYYRHLTPEERKKFNRRVAYFLFTKEWEAREGMDLSYEKRLLLAAVAVKLTFGFEYFELPHFQRIFIYPKQYYSNTTGQMHKGEVNLQGAVVMNWADAEEGIRDHDNGINLAIHEFAHAVYFENLKENDDYFFIPQEDLQHWYNVAADEFQRKRLNGRHYLRDYAFTNKEEFWAVSAEYFFEQPHEFKTSLPDYYDCMVRTFRQNPAEMYSRGEQIFA